MNVLIIGANGRTGRALVECALKRGHRVTAFCRPGRILERTHPQLTVHTAEDPFDALALAEAARAHDAVICVVGAPPRNPDRVRARTAEALVRGLPEVGVDRLVVLSTLGARETRSQLPRFIRWFVVPFILATAFRDHDEQEAIIQGSALNWTLVRPPNLTVDSAAESYRLNVDPSDPTMKWKLDRADLAQCLLDVVEDTSTFRRIVTVSAE
ncbi:MAG: NAD(P)H-binding protein [Myxococcota bacterium]